MHEPFYHFTDVGLSLAFCTYAYVSGFDCTYHVLNKAIANKSQSGEDDEIKKEIQ